jgi:hypothetical protein
MNFNRYHFQWLFAVILMASLSGCAYNVNPYSPSAKNVKHLSEQSLKKFQFATESSSNGLKSIMCRGAGPIVPPNNESYESYILKALHSEFELADLVSSESPVQLKGRLKHIDFDSGMSGGKWEITLQLTNGFEEYDFSSVYNFESYFVADKACQSVAQAFLPAVQRAISETINDPRFKALVNSAKAANVKTRLQ